MVDYCDIPLFMTTKQLAEIVGEHEGSIRRGIADGRIPADKVNGRRLIYRDVVFPVTHQAVGKLRDSHAGNEQAPGNEQRSDNVPGVL